MAVDRTPEFRQCIRDSQALLPQNTTTKPRRSSHGKHEDDQLNRATAVAYMQDAYTIVNICSINSRNGLLNKSQLKHIQALTKVLAVIKRPYLNVEVNDMVSARDAGAVVDLMTDGAVLASLKRLSGQQRDQVDLQAKMIITRCAERVRAMEQLEKSMLGVQTSACCNY
jgi:syntaxin 18